MELRTRPIQSDDHAGLEIVVSHLRSQIVLMHSMLETIERTGTYESDYIVESFRSIEEILRHLRRYIHR